MNSSLNLILVLTTLWAVTCVLSLDTHMNGGPSHEESPADDQVREMVKMFEPTIRNLYPNEVVSVEPLSYKTQVVAGTNYLIRAVVTDKYGNRSFVHLRLWKTLFDGVKFGAIRTQVDERTPLTSFMENDI